MDRQNVKELIPFVPKNEASNVVSVDNVHRIHDANDPALLYNSLVAAKQTVRISANSKLTALGKQMDFLIKEANKVVEKAKRDEQLHNVPCNLRKIVGNVYYLYEKDTGSKFFSMLSPADWGEQAAKFLYVGAYRLEADHGFTCLEGDDAAEDTQEENDRFRQMVNRITY
ncbi:unnamed protein product [Bursaphelenchus okinawaensis]|uniref:Uncharacterized protein n=1 Tax=Bursaphelenchus okinawaensis TaxID=465554 RepID=A0A811K6W9_9BILA|nr:unnamed protein product [Bursaphelenchus okinawaensis]CAG9092667.1 unnamed protein product [Bursaphelenchus okinawaensis]